MSIEDNEFYFSTKHFNWVRDTLYHLSGVVLSSSKKSMAYGRLARRIRQLGLDGFDPYIERIKTEPAEQDVFIGLMTTHLTSFFREKHHFEFLRQQIVPNLIKHKQRTFRCWSAGCSEGAEPYSIAISLAESIGINGPVDWHIYASDIDARVLETGSKGVYSKEEMNSVPEPDMQKYFLKGSGKQKGKVKIKPELRTHIEFSLINLISDWPIEMPLDLIFCRNVMIYFDQHTQVNILNRMADALKPDGYLFIGHSESITPLTDRFQLVGKTIYQRIR